MEPGAGLSSEKLTTILEAVKILSPTSFSFAGQLLPEPHAPLQQAQGLNAQQNPLISTLQQYLYQYCFCNAFKGRIENQPPAALPQDNLVQALSDANSSRARWDAGWQILRVEPAGQVVAQKNGLTRTFWPGEFVTHEGPGMPPRIGSGVSVFFAKESLTMQPGFYFAFGETVGEQQDDYRLVRFYWNVKRSGLTELLRLTTRCLNRFQVPFRFKCLSSATNFTRLDSAVLYVNKKFYRITAELLADVHARALELLEAEVPLFTKELARGLGLAEDPGNGESFGMNRCRLVAEAMWNAFLQGSEAPEARVREAVKQFENYGLNLERPYLNARSVDEYDFVPVELAQPHA